MENNFNCDYMFASIVILCTFSISVVDILCGYSWGLVIVYPKFMNANLGSLSGEFSDVVLYFSVIKLSSQYISQSKILHMVEAILHSNKCGFMFTSSDNHV